MAINPGLICMACGSYRRGRADCGDVDVLITHPDGKSHRGIFSPLLNALRESGLPASCSTLCASQVCLPATQRSARVRLACQFTQRTARVRLACQLLNALRESGLPASFTQRTARVRLACQLFNALRDSGLPASFAPISDKPFACSK